MSMETTVDSHSIDSPFPGGSGSSFWTQYREQELEKAKTAGYKPVPRNATAKLLVLAAREFE